MGLFKSKEEKERIKKEEEKQEEEDSKSDKEELLKDVESNKSGDYSTLRGKDAPMSDCFLDADDLNFLRENGWELVSFTHESDYNCYDYIFKRVEDKNV